ncbi:MAG: type II toxin-antitoxin system VapC family toxin [Egibacteraceae bacterium]
MRFVDTSYWVALQYAKDMNHAQARALWSSDPGPLLMTNLVLGETWTFLRRRTGYQAAVAFLDRAARSARVEVTRIQTADEDDAWGWLQRHDERAYSFVDATSFAVMRRHRLREALAFDGDFSAAGFTELRAPG